MYKKILVGIDDSQESMNAVKKAIELGKKDNSEVIVFHSVIHHIAEINPSFSLTPSSGTSMSLLIHEDYINLGEKLLKEVESLSKKNDKKIETRLILDISPEDFIKKAIKEEHFDLVILGFRGKHSKLREVFLGTIPDRVINNANCDVLIVR